MEERSHARYLQTVNRPDWLQTNDPADIASAASRSDDLESWARDCVTDLARFQVLAGTRRGVWGVEETNRRIRVWLGEAGLADADGAWFHGRPVMVNRNDYRTGLMNGDVGLCLHWPQDNGETAVRVVFQTADGQLHRYAPTRIVDCQTAWAMTGHKSQGSEFAHVVLMLPERDNPTLNATRHWRINKTSNLDKQCLRRVACDTRAQSVLQLSAPVQRAR